MHFDVTKCKKDQSATDKNGLKTLRVNMAYLSLFQTSSSGGSWSQYEITVVTCQMSNTVLKQVEKATKDIDAENLKV